MSHGISKEKFKEVDGLLKSIEKDNDISIIHAVESGSRAWGFPSADSDYDIRFIYHHSLDWYVSAFAKKDNIDLSFVGDLDAGGWDIGKSLQLMYKGNASIHEWLHSPVIYTSNAEKYGPIFELAKSVINPAAAFYHYLSFQKGK